MTQVPRNVRLAVPLVWSAAASQPAAPSVPVDPSLWLGDRGGTVHHSLPQRGPLAAAIGTASRTPVRSARLLRRLSSRTTIHPKPRGLVRLHQGQSSDSPCGPSRRFSATFPPLRMESSRKPTGVRELFAIAYAPSKNPKKALPGPLFDLSVVGLFLFLAIGYALT